MIYTLFILITFILVDTYIQKELKTKFKEAYLLIASSVFLASTFIKFQGYSITGLMNSAPQFNTLQAVFILILVISIYFDRDPKRIYRKLVAVTLLSTDVIEFQSTFLFGSLLLEQYRKQEKINLKLYPLFFLFLMIILGQPHFTLGVSLIALMFAAYLVKRECRKFEKTDFMDPLFFGIIIIVFSGSDPSLVTQLMLLFLSILFILFNSRIMLRVERDTFKSLLSLSFSFLSLVALVGLDSLFFFVASFLLVAQILRGRPPKTTLNWNLFFILFFLSPPFGLGYMVKVEIIEKIIQGPWYLYSLVAFFISLSQLFLVLSVIKLKIPILESFKNFKFGHDLKASIFIVLSLLCSLLFLPDSWVEGYGNLFGNSFIPEEFIVKGRVGVGYYLLWAELLVWSVFLLVYYKLSPKFFNRIYFVKILTVDGSSQKISNIEAQKKCKKVESISQFSFKNLVRAMELGKNNIPPQYFSLVMLTVLGLIVVGVL